MWPPLMILNKLASWPLTSEVREVKLEVKITKPILIYLLKIWYVILVGDSKPLKTLTFDLGGHWRSNYKNWLSSYSTKPFKTLYLRAFSATWSYQTLTLISDLIYIFINDLSYFWSLIESSIKSNAPLLWPNGRPCFF